MSETLIDNQGEHEYLADRQKQFAAILDVEPEELGHLTLCESCGGYDYIWTDWTLSPLPDGFTSSTDDAIAHRNYLAETACKDCDATGFQGGSFDFTKEQWLELGTQQASIG